MAANTAASWVRLRAGLFTANLAFSWIFLGAAMQSPASAQIVVNEILQNPAAVSDGAGEWFEVFNLTSSDVDIDGWTIRDDDFDSHVIDNGGPLVVPADGFLVLGNNANFSTNGGVNVDYRFSGIFLGNSADELVLLNGLGVEIDRVEWDGGPNFPDPNGASMSLVNATFDNNVGSNWCESVTPFGAGDLGTPGAVNDCSAELLLTELVVTPTAGEFIEIHNSGGSAVDLSDYYLTDATFAPGGVFYYNVVTGFNAGGGGFADFHARFPAGASIGPGEFQTVSLAGSDNFFAEYGIDPTYELFEDGASADSIPDMREALPGSINGQGGLTNSGEVVVLYFWDGASDLVSDVDYALWGDKDEAVDKTGVSIDGPDGDSTPSIYQPDTAISTQDVISPTGHASGDAFQRVDLSEGTETQSGSNGVGGADETSENLSVTWSTGDAPTPGASAPPPVLEIFEIQGAGAVSPFDDDLVTTNDNVVTSLAPDGFFMQTPVARSDGDIETSDGIFVFTGGAPGVAVGDLVDVTGEVDEFFGFTEITGSPVVTVDGTGTVPPAVTFDSTVPSSDPTAPSCSIEFECYEGMLVEIADGTVTGPNQRFNVDPIAEVFITAAPARTFREPGIEFPGLPSLPVWDGNPEVFELDPDKLGLPNLTIPAGSSFSAVGVLGFEFGGYELWPNQLTVVPAPLPVPVRPRRPGEFTVGSLNLFRLFDDVDDPPTVDAQGTPRDDAVVSTAEYLRRRGKFASHILEVLDAPDILAVQEAEKLGVLEDLADDIEAIDPTVVYEAFLVEGNDIGTIDVGFLVRDTIAVDAITQLGKDETFFNPVNVTEDILHDRPPLLLEGRCLLEFGDFPVKVMTVHNRSLGGIDDPVDGVRVRQKRFEQAESIAQKVQDLQSADPGVRLMVMGDFNAFEFTDGYVDGVGIIKGDFDPADNLVCDTNICSDLVEPDLTNQVLSLPPEERYSFIFRGSAQVLDHALTSQALANEVAGVEYGRGNADAAVDLINDVTTPANIPLRASDHDGLIVYILKDEDADGVPNDLDVCPGTVIPEGVPTSGSLGKNRWALTDDDGQFDQAPPQSGSKFIFTLADTGGCSCEQIIDELGLGVNHTRNGCSTSPMLQWVDLVSP